MSTDWNVTPPQHRLIGRVCTCGDWWAQCGNDVAGQWADHVRRTPAADHPTPTPSHATDAQAKEDQ